MTVNNDRDHARSHVQVKSGLPILIVAAIAGIALSAAAAHGVSQLYMGEGLAFRRLISAAGMVAVPASLVLYFLFLHIAKVLTRPISGNVLAALVLGSSIIVPIAVLKVEGDAYARGAAQTGSIVQALNAEVTRETDSYNAELRRLRVLGMTSARTLAGGFSQGEFMSRIKAARGANARLHADLDEKVAAARARLAAAKVSQRQKDQALRKFDRAFSQSGGDLKELTSYQSSRLAMLEHQVELLGKARWSASSGWVTFTTPSETDAWAQAERSRGLAEGNLRRLEDAFRTGARS